MSDTEDTHPRTKIIKLDGPDSYGAWYRSISNTLLIKDLSSIADGSEPMPLLTDTAQWKKWSRDDRKAWGLVDSSLSDVVHGSLPANLVEYISPVVEPAQTATSITPGIPQTSSPACSSLLLSYLRATYSANTGSRKAELWRAIWRNDLEEGVDPNVHLSSIRSAHSALLVSGTSLADSDLAYAILMSLPESYNTVVQSFYLLPLVTSAAVITAINVEWRRRHNAESTTALKARALLVNKPFLPEKAPSVSYPSNPNAYCDYHQRKGHSTKECVTKPKPRTAPLAAVAVSEYTQSTSDSARAAAAVVDSPSSDDSNTRVGQPLAFLASIGIPAHVLLAYSGCGQYIVDSGASHHMVQDCAALKDIRRLDVPINVTVANGQVVKSTESGKLPLRHTTLENVLVVPALGMNLLSVNRMTSSAGKEWTFGNGSAKLTDNGRSVITARLKDGLYFVDSTSTPIPPSALHTSVRADTPLSLWHRRLGHLGVREVIRLGKEGRLDDSVDWSSIERDVSKFQCFSCISGKGTRLPTHQSQVRATRPLQTIHVDLFGPTRTRSLGGNTYFLTCYDDCSRKIHLSFLKSKAETRQALIDYITLVERQLECTIRVIRSDQGGEFNSKELKQYFASKGIEHHETPADSHAQNGRVERAHLTILNSVRTLLFDSKLPDEFWAEAASYASYTRNRVPSGPQKLVPEDVWRGQSTSLTHLRPFGSRLFFRDHVEKDKLHPRYREGRLLSYVEGTHSYRVWDMDKKRVHISRDVVFEKTPSGDSNAPIDESVDRTHNSKVERYDPETYRFVSVSINDNDTLPSEDDNDLAPLQESVDEPMDEPVAPRRNPVRETRRGVDYAPQPQLHREEAPSAPQTPPRMRFDGVEITTRRVDEPVDDPGNGLLAHALLSTSVPQTFREARSSPEWSEWETAYKAELAKMDQYKVWDVIDRPNTKHILKAKWVFTRKIDGETGRPKAYKARWVAKGFSQTEGIDYNELYAGVAHKDSIRVFLALVNYSDLECDQVDIKAAFLNGELEETVYLEPPEGSNIPSDKVLLLRKSLYGLKQSPRCFNKKLDAWLQSEGLNPTSADGCVYIRQKENSFLMLSVHVDDQLIASTSRLELDEFKRRLNSQFECSDGGPASYFLGFNIFRDRPNKRLFISQEHYIESVLERFDMLDCKPARVPLPTTFKSLPATDDEFKEARHEDYPGMVGSIMYAATITRPDIAYAAGLLARTASKWNKTHVHAARHLLRYLRGTSDLCLTYDRTAGERIVLGYADADWGGCLDTRRSTTGYLFRTFGGPIAWRSRRQTTTALSTAEAEYMASSDATRQAIWLRQLLNDLGQGSSTPLTILNDNNAAIQLSRNPVNHDRTKHIDMRHHFLREKVADSTIELEHVNSENNLADLLTKPLASDQFATLRTKLGVTQRNERSSEGGC